MKKFIASLILVGMLSGCTYTAYTVQQDDQPKSEVKHVESKDNYYSIKDKRDKLINICHKVEDYPCIFIQRNRVDHFILFYPNEKEMLSSKESTMNIANAFYLSSMELSISSQFHVVILYENLAHDLNCSTDTWSEWYSTEKQKNNRY
jgi:hypothetical protein